MSHVQKRGPRGRRPYRSPSIESYTEQEIIAAIRPEADDGTMSTMPPDHGAGHGE